MSEGPRVALVVFDSKTKTYSRYQGKTRTHKVSVVEGHMTPEHVEVFRLQPDLFTVLPEESA